MARYDGSSSELEVNFPRFIGKCTAGQTHDWGNCNGVLGNTEYWSPQSLAEYWGPQCIDEY